MGTGKILRVEATLWSVQIKDIAQAAGLSPVYLSKVLHGHIQPRRRMIERIHAGILAAATERAAQEATR